jgi:hypothetical protein
MPHQVSTQAASPQRLPGHITFRNFAMLDGISLSSALPPTNDGAHLKPATPIVLDDHLLGYAGMALDKNDFVWGLAGSSCRSDSRYKAFMSAQANGKHMLEIEGRYRLDNFDRIRSGFDEEAAFAAGYLHVDRMKADLRDKLKNYLLGAAARRHDGLDVAKYSAKSLGDLLLDFPGLLQDLFDADDRIMMVVHRVRPTWDAQSRMGVYLCTMRRDKDRIVDFRVPDMPGLPICC